MPENQITTQKQKKFKFGAPLVAMTASTVMFSAAAHAWRSPAVRPCVKRLSQKNNFLRIQNFSLLFAFTVEGSNFKTKTKDGYNELPRESDRRVQQHE